LFKSNVFVFLDGFPIDYRHSFSLRQK